MNPDQELIQQVIKGDRKAQLLLYRLCFNLFYGICRRYKRNQEDIQTLINNAFIKLIVHLPNYEDKSRFEAWAKRILMNEIIDEHRKNKKYYETIKYDCPEDESHQVAAAPVADLYSSEELLRMINALPQATRVVFNLHAIDGYAHKEISQQLGITEETSKWHMKEARKKLKTFLVTVANIHETR